jgi:hypothetical protein
MPWTDMSYENFNSVTFILVGVGIGIVIIVCVVVTVWACYSRRTRRATYGTERARSEDTTDNASFAYYHTIPNNHQRCPNSCSADAMLLQPPDSSSSLENAPFTQRQGIHHTVSSSKPGTKPRVAVSHTYEEPYQHLYASGTYAVPYRHQQQQHAAAKTGESKISGENVFGTESNDEMYSDGVYIRNSLYLQQ